MNVFELFAKLGLDSSEYEKGLDNAINKADGAGSKIGSALKTAAQVGVAAITAAATAVTAFTASSVKTGMEFDSAISQVAATMGKSVAELQQDIGTAETSFGHFEGNLREFAQFLGENTAFSATQCAEALNFMALAGYDVQQSMDMLPNVLSLAAAGNFDLARASDMVTDTQTAFGLSAERTAQMVDEMAKAASTGNTSVEQLGDAFLVVGGLAKELNGGFIQLSDGTNASVDGIQELEIALTAMANAGVKGSEAGTHMRNMLLKLASPTKEGREAFDKLGVSVYDSTGKMKSLKQIFGELEVALSGLTQQEKLDAISDIFNVRDVASAEAILNAIGQDWDTIGQEILNAQGAAAQMAATQLDNLAGDITLFKSALEGAKIAISDVVTPALREFVQYGTSSVQQLATAFREDGLQGALNALGPVIQQGIALLFTSLPQVLQAAISLLQAFVSGIVSNLPLLVPAAIQLVQMFGSSIVQMLPTLRDGIVAAIMALLDSLGLGDIVRSFVNNVAGPVNEALSKIRDTAANAFERIKQAIQPLLDKFSQYVSSGKAMEDVSALVATAVGLLANAISGLINFVATAVEKISAFVGWLNSGSAGAETFKAVIVGLVAAFATFQIISTVISLFSSLSAIVSVVQGAFAAFNAILLANPIALVVAAIAGLVAAFVYLWNNCEGFREFWINLWDKIKEYFTATVDRIKLDFEILKVALGVLHDWFSAKIDGMKTAWSNFKEHIHKIGENIKQTWETLKTTASNVADSIQKSWANAKGWGSTLISNIRAGIAERVGEIRSQIQELISSISDIFRNLGSSAVEWGRDLIGNFVAGLNEKLQALKDKAVAIAQQIKDVIGFSEPKEGPLSRFHTFAPDMMELFARGIRENEHLITDAVKSSFDIGDQISDFGSGTVVSTGNGYGVSGTARNQTVVLQVGRTELGRLVYELYNEEQQRMGVKLAAGGIA